MLREVDVIIYLSGLSISCYRHAVIPTVHDIFVGNYSLYHRRHLGYTTGNKWSLFDILNHNLQLSSAYFTRSLLFILIFCILQCRNDAYSDSKYRFAIKKSSKFSYKILLLSDSTFFKQFSHMFAAIIEALTVAGHKFLYTLLIECDRLRC